MSNSHLFVLSILTHKKTELNTLEHQDIEFIEFLEVICPGTRIVEIDEDITQDGNELDVQDRRSMRKYHFIPGILLDKKHIDFVFSVNIVHFIDSFLLLCTFLKIKLVITGVDEVIEKKNSTLSLPGEDASKDNENHDRIFRDDHDKYNSDSPLYSSAPLYNIIPKLSFLSLFDIRISHQIESIKHPLNGQTGIRLTIKSMEPLRNIKPITIMNNPKQITALLISHEGNKFVFEQIRKWLKEEVQNIKFDHIKNIRTWSIILDEDCQLKGEIKNERPRRDRLSCDSNIGTSKPHKNKNSVKSKNKIAHKPTNKGISVASDSPQKFQRRGVTCVFYSGQLFSCFTLKRMNKAIIQEEMSQLFRKILKHDSVDDELSILMYIICSLADGISNIEMNTKNSDKDGIITQIRRILDCKWIYDKGILRIRGIGYKFEQ